jgi:hypothetical protein
LSPLCVLVFHYTIVFPYAGFSLERWGIGVVEGSSCSKRITVWRILLHLV